MVLIPLFTFASTVCRYMSIQKSLQPLRPVNLSASNIAETSATLSWHDNHDATHWLVYLNDSLVATATDTTFTFADLTAFTDYTLKVVAVNNDGQSDPASVSIRTIDTTAPLAPTMLKAEVQSPYSIALTWQPAEDNVGIARYRVYVNGVQEARPKTCAYTLTGLEFETTYVISVEALDTSGNVSPQVTITANTGDDPLAVTSVNATTTTPLVVYTLDGTPISATGIDALPKGIYIINGKIVKIKY